MKQSIFPILLCLFFFQAKSQDFDNYRSSNNSLYWKNRKPDAMYWQQDVHYSINAKIDEVSNIIEADETLDYWNNSPDTLTCIFFHLYQNAFVKGSYLHQLEKEQKQKATLGVYESMGSGTIIEEMKVNGKIASTELDNTILKVELEQPLPPNSHVTLSMIFYTHYDNGSTRRRMKMYDAWGNKHFNGVQWFPKVCVYDRKFGWDTYQHLNKEFYGDYGVFDVNLDFASNYIVEATGVLQNRTEVLPDTLRAKLDVKNFKNKPLNETPSIIIPYEKGERKVWKYHAVNVHDFAFTADPTYRIATTYWKGIECVGLVQEPHAAGWQNSADYVAKIISTFSNDFGMYAYPKMVAADAQDGMEYPMLTLDGGTDPGYRGLLVHELGHNWFYGMVGNNETYRAALDEGFTQFLTAWGLEKIDGKYLPEAQPKTKFKRRFYEPTVVKDVRVFNSYLWTALNNEELPLNTHSNDFQDALGHEGGYGMVYYKTATMLYNLQYTLGDSLFLASMQHYFNQWKMAHPYFEDFRNSIIQFTHVDLNWFFDEWMETTKKIDYSIDKFKPIFGTDHNYAIHFSRKGQMQMPLDFTVTEKNGTITNYHIPNTWFTKQTSATVLPKWYGWSKIQPHYTATVTAPSGIRSIQIDTSGRLADINALNNFKSSRGFFRSDVCQWKTDGGFTSALDRKHYRIYARPDVWWNQVDGIKLGYHFEGDYMRTLHRFDASVWMNTRLLHNLNLPEENNNQHRNDFPINFSFHYNHPITFNHVTHELNLSASLLDGLFYWKVGHTIKVTDNLSSLLYFQSFWRPFTSDFDYLLYPNEWSSIKVHPNNSANFIIAKSYHGFQSNGNWQFHVRSPLFTGNEKDDFNYSFVQFTNNHYTHLRKLDIRTRFFARYGAGSNIPYESMLCLAGANPEELMNNKYTRSAGFVPSDLMGINADRTNNFQMGGGLNLRGYSGYMVADVRDGNTYIAYKGRSGASASLEVDFDNYFKLHPKRFRNWLHVDAYGFADAGTMELSLLNSISTYYKATPVVQYSDIRIDAGLGCAFTIKKWGAFDKAKPLTLRLDFPIFLNRPPYGKDNIAIDRLMVGIGRCF